MFSFILLVFRGGDIPEREEGNSSREVEATLSSTCHYGCLHFVTQNVEPQGDQPELGDPT